MSHNPARAGDLIAGKALLILLNLYPSESENYRRSVQVEVAPKPLETCATNGRWICIDCGKLPENNLMAQVHMDNRGQHRVGFLNFETCNVEAP